MTDRVLELKPHNSSGENRNPSQGEVLVTGGAGFIGSHLTEALVAGGRRVRVLDNLSSGALSNLSGVRDKIEFVEGDIRDRELLGKTLRKVSLVFHLAAMASVPLSLTDPALCLAINGEGALNVFEEAVRAGASRLVYASTSAVYGDLPGPHAESLAPRADTPYAALKLLGENFALYYQEQRGLDTVSLRYFNVYGPRQSPDGPDSGVIPRFIKKISRGEPPLIHGDGSQTRDFIHVSDVVRATILAGKAGAPGGIYNIATGAPVSINSLAELLRELSPGSPPPEYLPARPGDPEHSWGSVERAARDLGFRPALDLAEGLKGLLEERARKSGGESRKGRGPGARY
ncbi:MAG: NAD-dependent epimerase/dehydratase family protein [Deltaproteobacteria bacterium]|jgi:UDP-glucose 4-epimerase|nr:NAD-dependent epimerase/dehydratase family protein [Deltaproteobacteria bacterium]